MCSVSTIGCLALVRSEVRALQHGRSRKSSSVSLTQIFKTVIRCKEIGGKKFGGFYFALLLLALSVTMLSMMVNRVLRGYSETLVGRDFVSSFILGVAHLFFWTTVHCFMNRFETAMKSMISSQTVTVDSRTINRLRKARRISLMVSACLVLNIMGFMLGDELAATFRDGYVSFFPLAAFVNCWLVNVLLGSLIQQIKHVDSLAVASKQSEANESAAKSGQSSLASQLGVDKALQVIKKSVTETRSLEGLASQLIIGRALIILVGFLSGLLALATPIAPWSVGMMNTILLCLSVPMMIIVVIAIFFKRTTRVRPHQGGSQKKAPTILPSISSISSSTASLEIKS